MLPAAKIIQYDVCSVINEALHKYMLIPGVGNLAVAIGDLVSKGTVYCVGGKVKD